MQEQQGDKTSPLGGSAVVLTHFCETHGPSVVFITQAIHSTSLPTNISLTHIPTQNETLSTKEVGEHKDHPIETRDTSCSTCRSVPEGTGLESVEEDNPEISYISTHHPSTSTYATIRTACVRSLSCEISPRDAPILFSSGFPDGEGQEWGVVSYVFRLADGQARGSSRMYSILVMLSDVTFLVHSFTWLAASLRAFVTELQSRAKKQSPPPQQNIPNSTTPSRSMPRDPSFRGRASRTVSLRPLADLMDDKEFFHKVHSRFCWVMQSCVRRVGSRMFHIPHVTDDAGTAIHAGTAISFADIRRYLGADGFHVVLYNVLVGNQIVIRGDTIDLAVAIAYSLSLLLPSGCGVTVQHFTHYLHAYEASMLVIPERCVLPHDLEPSSFVLVDMYNASTPQNVSFNVKGVAEVTTLGVAMEKILEQDKSKEDLKLSILIEEWTAKAKAFARLRPLCNGPTDPKLHSFAKALGLTHEADYKVLAFWATGLRKAKLTKDVV